MLGVAMASAAAMPQPVIWHFLGYPYEAASLIAAVFAAVTTRVVIGLRSRSVTYALDAAVLVLVLVTTCGVVIAFRTSLIMGLLYGTGLATIGEGIIRIAERYTAKGLSALGIEPPPPPGALPPADEDHPAKIGTALDKLDKLD